MNKITPRRVLRAYRKIGKLPVTGIGRDDGRVCALMAIFEAEQIEYCTDLGVTSLYAVGFISGFDAEGPPLDFSSDDEYDVARRDGFAAREAVMEAYPEEFGE